MSGTNYKTSFQDIWLEDDKYKLLLSWAIDSYSAKCNVEKFFLWQLKESKH